MNNNLDFKIIFTCLGPSKTYTIDENKYSDGDVVSVDQTMYNILVEQTHYAHEWTPEIEERIKKSLASADKKRKEILEKMSRVQQ